MRGKPALERHDRCAELGIAIGPDAPIMAAPDEAGTARNRAFFAPQALMPTSDEASGRPLVGDAWWNGRGEPGGRRRVPGSRLFRQTLCH